MPLSIPLVSIDKPMDSISFAMRAPKEKAPWLATRGSKWKRPARGGPSEE
jgi:hypothetical protein